MAITCQLVVDDKPIEGVFVDLSCLNNPQQQFEGYTNKLGMIDEWYDPDDDKMRAVTLSPNIEGLRFHMRFHMKTFVGKRYFSANWHATWVPQKDNSHVVFRVETLGDDTSHSHPSRQPNTISQIPSVIQDPSDSEDLELRVFHHMPWGRLFAGGEQSSVDAGPNALGATPGASAVHRLPLWLRGRH